MRKKKQLYPGVDAVEAEKIRQFKECHEDSPDFIGNAPNYNKFEGWSPEEVLVWLNID